MSEIVEPAAGAPPVTRRPRRSARGVAVGLGVMVAAVVVFLLLGEVVIRIVGRVKGVNYSLYLRELSNFDRLPSRLQAPHPTRRWALVPREQVVATTSDFSVPYRINSKGLRDREYPYRKPPDKIRAVALGDSLTFGEGIPFGDRFTDIAEQRFRNLEVITMAVPGYGLDQMLLTFAEDGVKYQPDVVLVFLAWTVVGRHSLGPGWVDHAPIDTIATQAAADTGPSETVYRRRDDDRFSAGRYFLLRQSHFLSYLSYKVSLILLRPQMKRSDLQLWGPRNINDTAIAMPTAQTAQSDEYLRTGLRHLAALAAKMKFRIIVVNIEPSWDFKVSDLPAGTAVLDLSPQLRAAAAKRSIRFIYDPHYNPTTNRLIGDLLTEGLRANVPGLIE
jgi:hypothetical protein